MADWKRIDKELIRIGRTHRGAFFPFHPNGPRLFIDPVERVRVSDPNQLTPALQKLEELRKKYTLVGWIAYEVGAELKPLVSAGPDSRPLLEFSAYSAATEIGSEESKQDFGSYRLDELYWTETRNSYRHKVQRIRSEIQNGNVYQVNFTHRLRFRFRGDPRALFRDLCRSQPVTGAALFRQPDQWILSLSPELFVRVQGGQIEVQPMKGTLSRGRTIEEDDRRMSRLARDPKNRAENLMIVDLMRNDLGRVAKIGTVEVRKLFEIHRLPTVLQMTSTVRAKLRSVPLSVREFLEALFPCGSVTGAPKLAAMRLIEQMENTPRGVYCGALGIVDSTNLTFQVGIRTLSLKPVGDETLSGDPSGTYEGEMGIGSGIVADSDPEIEWEECGWKARFLTARPPEFQLIETLSLNGILHRLQGHLQRMQRSAAYFDFPFNEQKIRTFLQDLVQQFQPPSGSRTLVEPGAEREGTGTGLFKVRVLLSREGELQGSIEPVRPVQEPVVVALARERVDSSEIWLYHKTTNRSLYSAAQEVCREQRVFDLIFRNERDELTEGSISNLFIRIDDEWLTPQLGSGLLPGVMRKFLVETLPAREAVLDLEDLRQASQILVSNSVQGAVECKFVDREASVLAPEA